MHIRHLHFRTNLTGRYPWSICPHRDGPLRADLSAYDLTEDEYAYWMNNSDDNDLNDIMSEYDWGNHRRNFYHLSFASGIIINGLYHNQLRSFSWDLGTCIPEIVLGPSGIITSRQKLLEDISLTTVPDCSTEDNIAINGDPHPCCQASIIVLDNFQNLKSIRWRGPRSKDIDTLSNAIKNNRINLTKLELDFLDGVVDWIELPEQSDECPLFMQFLGMPPNPSSSAFPHLQELSLSCAAIGPALASALDMHSLVLLKLDRCDGWARFLERMTESKVIPKLKSLEISSSSNDPPGQGEQAIANFIGSFGGLEKLHLDIFPSLWPTSWVPTRTFWNGVIRHRSTLRSCIFDQLWVDKTEARTSLAPFVQQRTISAQRQNTALQQFLDCIEQKPQSNVLNLLNPECLGLINEPTCLRRMLLPFTEKDSLKIIHVRTGWRVPPSEWVWARKDFVKSEKTWSGSYCGTNLRALWPNVNDLYGRYRLQEKFCAFVEWAFGPKGIASLRILAVGDFLNECDSQETRFSICRNEDGTFTFLDGRDGRRDRALDEYRDFLASCK
ncbi:hypothetical protein BGZ63DRAFT_475943 [Mariannaea sp. PMI_226]|nr:hypothetical protein BGZ63DRAFT_475943 [Mariannaea sp. PMI_226]